MKICIVTPAVTCGDGQGRSLKALPEIFTRSRVSEIWNIQSLSPLS